MTVMIGEDPAAPEPLTDEERAEAESYELLVYELSVLMMRLDGNDGDPHHLIWEGGPVPEPWGDVWQKYEPQALSVLEAIGEESGRAMLELARNAARYGWLREQHWYESSLAVVADPKRAVQVGYDCPSLDRLDAAIDAAMAKTEGKDTP